ncbi:MAG: Alpha/beta hydrolase fold-3 domain protein [Xanthobacteraceae bacterium]|jgi:acetyl esterase|nr:Alpha/beta hydrolase fold-3 domain protein [Xanthobacteraceae bacterium]
MMSANVSSNWTEDRLRTGGDAELRVRVYRAAGTPRSAPLVFHLHSGAFVAGCLACGEPVASLIAKAGATVVSADYPLAPEHRFPEALNLTFGGLRALYKERAKWAGRTSSLFVAGEEAGANIAAALALMARDQGAPPLAGQILLSPMLDPCLATRSIRDAQAGSVGCKWADGWHRYLGTADKGAHPYAAPLGSRRLQNLAPALVVTAEDDPLRDESVAYAKRLVACEVDVREIVLPGPTNWPDALGLRPNVEPDWMGPVGRLVSEFLANPLGSAASVHSEHSIRA